MSSASKAAGAPSREGATALRSGDVVANEHVRGQVESVQPAVVAEEYVEPRRVRLTLTRVNPFSVMKVAFMVSFGLGVAGVVMSVVLWMLLNGMGVFTSVNDVLSELPTGANSRLNVGEYLTLGKTLGYSLALGVIDIIILTALATLLALIYNLCAALVGGVRVTLSDE